MKLSEDSFGLGQSTVDISELEPRLDFNSDNDNSSSSSGTILRSFGITKGGLAVLFLITYFLVSCHPTDS